jgi:tetratricopeptide (TPR) repeat protein
MNTIDIDSESVAQGTQAVFHPNILLVHWETHTRNRNWTAANNTALGIMNAMPAEPIGWIYRSFALCQLGRIAEAHENLLDAARRFPNDWRIPYNLASYTSKLGDRAGAWNWLDRAIELGDADAIKSLALEDPIFRSFWQELGQAK